jgi:hypothetical protein
MTSFDYITDLTLIAVVVPERRRQSTSRGPSGRMRGVDMSNLTNADQAAAICNTSSLAHTGS